MEYLIENFQSFANVYITVLIELYLLCVTLLYAVWMKPFTVRKKAVWISVAVYYVLQTINNHTGTDKNIDRLIAIGVIMTTFLAVWILDDRRNPVQKIFLCVIFRLISWLTSEILTEIGMYESKLVMESDWYRYSINATVIEFIIWNFIQYGMAVFLLYTVIRVLHRAYMRKTEELFWQEFVMLLTPAWSLLLVKPIMSSYFMLWMDGIENGSIKENIPGNLFRLVFSICSLLSIVAIIVLYQRLNDSKDQVFAARSLENRMDDMRRHTDQVEEMHERVRALKHDMGNHLAVIMHLAETGKSGELSEYIRSLQKTYEETDIHMKTGNPVTDVILSEYAEHFQKSGIGYNFDFKYPDGTGINAFDVSIILTNSLQNAIEASVSCQKPEVHLKSAIHDNVFIINVRNHMDSKRMISGDGIPETTKKTEGHGYGLKNIRNIATKYKGDIAIRQEDTGEGYDFILNVMLLG